MMMMMVCCNLAWQLHMRLCILVGPYHPGVQQPVCCSNLPSLRVGACTACGPPAVARSIAGTVLGGTVAAAVLAPAIATQTCLSACCLMG
jgi:hypothetical protein